MKKEETTLYILHGWSVHRNNAGKWEKIRSHLTNVGIETEFLDLPGFSKPLEKEWSLDEYVNWLGESLPQKPVVLLGHSFGGQIATRFAAQHPEHVEKLILIASSGIVDRSFKAQAKRKIFYILAQIGKVFSFIPFARKFLYLLAGERDYYQAAPLLRKTMANVLADEIIADLPKIKAPTLLIWGENDTATPLRNTAVFLKIKNSSLTTIPDARHSPQFTHPEKVVSAIQKFIEMDA
jgi:pimeloyl-ACP methyl ester carboxylesterase